VHRVDRKHGHSRDLLGWIRVLGGHVALACLQGILPAAGVAWAQALPPDEAQRRFKLAPGFEVELFAAEPEVRQPVTMTFDDRGRMWVIQYLQYPNPAGLRPVEVDRYLRTKYDRVPEPPPRGPVGKDKITILEDTDGDGRADKTKDFVTGLNLASALAIGNGGVYVGQAPYLLFYPDHDGDDVPDGEPEVLLKGFGMEDAHAVVNSLEWGPDGWLYGAQGSTVTADIRGIGFQQGIWRYHPRTKQFELFSEGGGNTWGLDFDARGNVIAGTNYSNVVCLHQVQGGYYVKGFSKHGPLHNPYTYGYFEHVTHSGHAGGHVTCGGIVYQGSAWPERYRGMYVGANLLSNAIYLSSFQPHGSTFKTTYRETLLETDDIWFRPIDCLTGPDGSVYVADWYDKRANHVIPEDTWDKTNGRIWKIVYRGSDVSRPKAPPVVDLSQKSTPELVELLNHENVWQRRVARRILGERQDPASLALLRVHLASSNESQALEALWALYVSGGWSDDLAAQLLKHPSADIRAWTVRLIGDDCRALPGTLHDGLLALASDEPEARVRSQLACTAKRLLAADGLPLIERLLARDEGIADPHVPLLLWWALEDKAVSHRDEVLGLFANPPAWQLKLVREVVAQRLARRYLAERSDEGYASCARLLAHAPTEPDKLRLVAALEADLSGRPLEAVPSALGEAIESLRERHAGDPTVTRLALKLGSRAAYQQALTQMADPGEPAAVRLAMISAVGSAARADAVPILLSMVDDRTADEAIRGAALSALGNYDDAALGRQLLDRYQTLPPGVRTRVITLAASRAAWSQLLVQHVAAGKIESKDVSVDQVRQMLAHGDETLAAEIEARWGKIRPATPGEKMSYVPVLGRVLNAGTGNLESGHKLFMKHCGVCHTLHGEGEKIGPDLTSADRKNREALLLNILDPSGTIRPEYISQTAVLVDGRVLTGLVIESSPQQITIVDAKQQKTTVARSDIEQIEPSSVSLMPERLLEQLGEQEIRDLFRYLQSDRAPERAAAK
jgi:putative membrane-bound dehydrogenase-like protein